MRQANLKKGMLDAASEPEEGGCLMRQANLSRSGMLDAASEPEGMLDSASEPEEGDA